MRFQRKVRGSTLTVSGTNRQQFLGARRRAALGRGTMDLQQQIAALAAVGAAPAPRPYECRPQAACGAASPCMLPRVTDVSLRPSCVCASALPYVWWWVCFFRVCSITSRPGTDWTAPCRQPRYVRPCACVVIGCDVFLQRLERFVLQGSLLTVGGNGRSQSRSTKLRQSTLQSLRALPARGCVSMCASALSAEHITVCIIPRGRGCMRCLSWRGPLTSSAARPASGCRAPPVRPQMRTAAKSRAGRCRGGRLGRGTSSSCELRRQIATRHVCVSLPR